MFVIGYGTVTKTENLELLTPQMRYHNGLQYIERGKYTIILIDSSVKDFYGDIAITQFPSYPVNGYQRLMAEVFNLLPDAVEPDLVIAHLPAVKEEETDDDTEGDTDDKATKGSGTAS